MAFDPRALSEIYGTTAGDDDGGGVAGNLVATDPKYKQIVDYIHGGGLRIKDALSSSQLDAYRSYARANDLYGIDTPDAFSKVAIGLGWAKPYEAHTPPTTPNPNQNMFSLDPSLLQFLGKYGVNATSPMPAGTQNIFDLPTTSFDPMSATQRGVFF